MAGQLTMHMAILQYVSLFLFQTVSAHVDPPTNVTLHCHNLHDHLQWSYEPLVPGLRFRVEIRSLRSTPKEMWVAPPVLHANVSLLTDPVDDNMLTVTAFIGQNKSKPAGGTTFSYSKVSLVKQKCFVDFPSVAVSVDPDGHVLFNFNHPWLLYSYGFPQTKSRRKKSNEEKASVQLPEFKYSVKLNQHLEEELICATSVCEGKLQAEPGQGRNCLKVEGDLQMMFVQGSQEYCTMYSTPEWNNISIAFIIIGVLAVAVIVVIFYMWFKKKTRASSLLPKSMNIAGQQRQWSSEMSRDHVLVPEVEPRSPSPLLRDENENEADLTPSALSSADPDLRFCLGVPAENEVAGEENGGAPGYMEGRDLEPETLNETGYEQRPGVGVVVELAPGELAEGYRDRI